MEYSETRRDRVERRLANKRELIDEQRNGLVIQVYWLRLTNQVSMRLETENGEGREFLVPNDSVLEARDHPEAFAARAGLPRAYEN